MALLNFKKQFIDSILSGEKRQTIRKKRKYKLVKNDNLYIYTGLMHKGAIKLLETKIKKISDIYIDDFVIKKNNFEIKDKDFFSIQDGFENFDNMTNFIKKQYYLPFEGILIEW